MKKLLKITANSKKGVRKHEFNCYESTKHKTKE